MNDDDRLRTDDTSEAPGRPEEPDLMEPSADSGQRRHLEESLPTTPPPAATQDGGQTDDMAATGESSSGPPPSGLTRSELRGALEAVLYAASEPLSLRELKKIFPKAAPEDVKRSVEELVHLYAGDGRGLHIMEVAGGYQIATRPEYHERVSSLFKFKPPSRLSIQALETLATIAYRQPITLPEIQELRGVRSSSVIRTLLERKLIRIRGRKNVVGRPLLYGTTKEFLIRFGLKDLSELPRLEDMAEVFGEDVALQLDDLEPKATSAAEEEAVTPGEETTDAPSDPEGPKEAPNVRDTGLGSPD